MIMAITVRNLMEDGWRRWASRSQVVSDLDMPKIPMANFSHQIQSRKNTMSRVIATQLAHSINQLKTLCGRGRCLGIENKAAISNKFQNDIEAVML
mmetsp:Transcript_10295/g.25196  ORF Transcript_10295/g.25196 Transcript_10295/m.25196 type:complete len:96 (+) Transcript_10295:591-878(+)